MFILVLRAVGSRYLPVLPLIKTTSPSVLTTTAGGACACNIKYSAAAWRVSRGGAELPEGGIGGSRFALDDRGKGVIKKSGGSPGTFSWRTYRRIFESAAANRSFIRPTVSELPRRRTPPVRML